MEEDEKIIDEVFSLASILGITSNTARNLSKTLTSAMNIGHGFDSLYNHHSSHGGKNLDDYHEDSKELSFIAQSVMDIVEVTTQENRRKICELGMLQIPCDLEENDNKLKNLELRFCLYKELIERELYKYEQNMQKLQLNSLFSEVSSLLIDHIMFDAPISRATRKMNNEKISPSVGSFGATKLESFKDVDINEMVYPAQIDQFAIEKKERRNEKLSHEFKELLKREIPPSMHNSDGVPCDLEMLSLAAVLRSNGLAINLDDLNGERCESNEEGEFDVTLPLTQEELAAVNISDDDSF